MPARRARLIALLASLWIVLVTVLGAGWVVLVIHQARQISELQALTGSTDSAVAAQWDSTRRRIVGESAVFLMLLLARERAARLAVLARKPPRACHAGFFCGRDP